jgi:plastocyanin
LLAAQALILYHLFDNTNLVIMKYIQALPFLAGLAAAEMQVMSLAAQPASGPMTHTVSFLSHTLQLDFNNPQIRVGGLKPVETGMAPNLGFIPDQITAKVGDVVMFEFFQKNHTATQSTFAQPCKKMEGGMDSGFMPNPEGKPGVTWNMTVETEDALCKTTRR